VAQLDVVLRLHRTKGSSATHFLPCLFILSKILGFRPCKTMPLAHSTWPFVFEWATADQSTQMWWLSQKSKNFLPMN
jgi:hypothetical protein